MAFSMKIGVKGKRYGLMLPKKKPTPKRTLSIFDNALEDDDMDAAEQIKAASLKRNQKLVEEEHKRILAEDPHAFDYDAVYDDMKAQEQARKPQEDKGKIKKPKYIKRLMEMAQQRKWDYQNAKDRLSRKEIEEEKEIYGQTEKFVTSAYKQKLQEEKRWDEEQKKKGDEDVTKKKDLTSFYSNLYHNIAFGGEGDTKTKVIHPTLEKAHLQYEEGVLKHNPALQDEPTQQQTPTKENVPSPEEVKPPSSMSEYSRESEQDSTHEAKESVSECLPSNTSEPVAKDNQQLDVAKKYFQNSKQQWVEKVRKGAELAERVKQQDNEREKRKRSKDAGRRNDDEAVKAARERYLARKKQRLGKEQR